MANPALEATAPIRQGTHDNAQLLDRLRTIVGRSHVLTGEATTRRYRTGFRFGSGPALAVVRPSALVELWKVLQACAAANKIIIMQAANTASPAARLRTGPITIARSSSLPRCA